LTELTRANFLTIFDILTETIYEILLTTISKTGVLNTAPFGVKFCQHGETTELQAYDGSTTLSNLKTTGRCIINFTQDPVLFYRALSKKIVRIENNNDLLERALSYQKRAINGLRPLEGVQGYIVARVIDIVPRGINYLITLEPINCVQDGRNVVFSRGSAALIEMMIHLSRLGVYSDQERNEDLLQRIKKLNFIVKKTSGSSWIALGNEIQIKAEQLHETLK
jgi:hypothetical protein